jgi:hypothetical protein
MFSKLEEMRSVITEVNNQFKDPVSSDTVWWRGGGNIKHIFVEHNHFCMCLYFRILVLVWNWTYDSRIDILPYWHS